MKKQLFLLAFAALSFQATPALADRDDDWKYWKHDEDGARDRGRGRHDGWRNKDDDGGTADGSEALDEATDGHLGEGD